MEASYKRLLLERDTDDTENSGAEYKTIARKNQEGLPMNANDILLWMSVRRAGSWASYTNTLEEMATVTDEYGEEQIDSDLPGYQRLRLNFERALPTSSSTARFSKWLARRAANHRNHKWNVSWNLVWRTD